MPKRLGAVHSRVRPYPIARGMLKVRRVALREPHTSTSRCVAHINNECKHECCRWVEKWIIYSIYCAFEGLYPREYLLNNPEAAFYSGLLPTSYHIHIIIQFAAPSQIRLVDVYMSEKTCVDTYTIVCYTACREKQFLFVLLLLFQISHSVVRTFKCTSFVYAGVLHLEHERVTSGCYDIFLLKLLYRSLKASLGTLSML